MICLTGSSKPSKLTQFREIVVSLIQSYFTDNIPRSSAELSYYLLFSLFPILLLIGTLLSITNISQVSLLHLLSLLPRDIQRIVSPVITRYLGQGTSGTFYLQIATAVVLGTYFFSRTMGSLMYNVNRIYHIPNHRGGVVQLIFEVLSAAGFIVTVIGSFILLVLGRTLYNFVSHFIEIPEQAYRLWNYGRYLLAIGVLFLFLLILFYLAPNCIMRLRDSLPGAIFTLLAWFICSTAFTFYINNINRYDALYGSISAIMVLMLWMYMIGIILFLGFKLNFILMQRKHMNFIAKGTPWYLRGISRIINKIKRNLKG